jgi:hypothetical protein
LPQSIRSIRSLLNEWRSLLKQEQRVVSRLSRTLPGVSRNARVAGPSLRRRISCPKCDRRFALPMNLGRHLAATHRRRKRAA